MKKKMPFEKKPLKKTLKKRKEKTPSRKSLKKSPLGPKTLQRKKKPSSKNLEKKRATLKKIEKETVEKKKPKRRIWETNLKKKTQFLRKNRFGKTKLAEKETNPLKNKQTLLQKKNI